MSASLPSRGRATLDALLSGRGLATIFVGYGLLAVLLIALVTPPYQVSDEIAHLYRADQVRRGQLVGIRLNGASGGVVDQGIAATADIFSPLILRPENKATRDMFSRAAGIRWGGGDGFSRFENTSIYPPFFYAPSSLAIAAGKGLNLSVVSTLYLARILNGVLAVLLGALAIRLAGSAAPWVFALLALPMSMSQMASVSQDALLIPTAAVAAGLYARVLRGENAFTPEREEAARFLALCALLALIATGRIAYAGLAVLALVPAQIPLGLRLFGAALIAAAAAAWSWVASTFALIQFGLEGANAQGQMGHLLANPLRVFPLAWNTFRFQIDLYLESFVGKLGWLDLRLPFAYLVTAWIGLILAALASVLGSGRPAPVQAGGRPLWLTWLGVALSAGTVFAALYITWTPVGNFIVDGVQGRYFIPLAFFALVPLALRNGNLSTMRAGAAAMVVLIFTLLTLPVVIEGLIDRYYLH